MASDGLAAPRAVSSQSGMSLLESLVAVALIGIGFVGLQAFYSIAQRTIAASSTKIQVNLAAEQIMEDITLDAANVATYNGVDLTNCARLTDKKKVWCERMQSKEVAGAINTSSGKEYRRIRVTPVTGVANTWMVTVELATHEGRNHVVIRRRVRSL